MLGMNATTGRAISGLDHIQQSLANILTTPIGSRLMRRRYGSDVPELIDQPMNGATQLRIYAAVAHAVMLWEPRIHLTSLQLENDQTGAATLTLEGIANGSNVQLQVAVGQGSAA